MNRNLAIRLLTSAVVAPLLLLVMFQAPPWGWYIIVFVASAIGSMEWFGMTHSGDRVAQAVGVLQTLTVSAVLYFFTTDAKILIALLIGNVIVGALVPLWRLGDISTAALRIASGIAGPFYVGGLLVTIGLIQRDNGAFGPGFVVIILCYAWLGDTGGYFAGRFLGKHKLYPAVSPKKTREGFVGSLAGSVVGGTVAHLLLVPHVPTWHIVVLAIVTGALGQLGDLVESLLKRSTGIKDSGWIVPGHGGILDRIDAVLIVSPLMYLYTVWLAPSPPGG